MLEDEEINQEEEEEEEETYREITESLKPVVKEILNHLKQVGLTRDDFVTLVVRKVRNEGISRTKVEIVVSAILDIERRIPR